MVKASHAPIDPPLDVPAAVWPMRPDPDRAPGGGPADPAAAADQRALWAMIDALGVPHACHVHRPVATVADSAPIHRALPGLHAKNLFLTDRRDALWLVTVPDSASVDLGALATRLGARRLSFAAPPVLWRTCRLLPGSVTPLGVLADDARRVALVLDAALAIAPWVCVHPLRNDATLSLPGPRLIDMAHRMGHAPMVAAIPRRTPPAARVVEPG